MFISYDGEKLSMIKKEPFNHKKIIDYLTSCGINNICIVRGKIIKFELNKDLTEQQITEFKSLLDTMDIHKSINAEAVE